jgi:putative addiction module component (TIGR02574 family)
MAREHLEALLKLPVEERALAAEVLLASLDEAPADPEVDAAWGRELTRRAQAVRDGTAELLDEDEVRRRIAAVLAKPRRR